MSFLGIIIAIILLIILIYKQVNLIPASLICVLLLSITSSISFTDLVMNHYAISLSEFIAKYFMLFVANALFGKIMEETLLVSAFSKMIGKSFGKKNAAFGAMLATALLSYGGISAFVIVFTVYPIFLATFRDADLPRKFIPACIMCSTCTVPLSMLPGGAQLNNIIPSQYIGTSPMAAPIVGIISSIITTIFIVVYFSFLFKQARIKGEHFEVDSDILKRISRFEQDPKIPAWLSLLPMILIVFLINFVQMDLSYAVFMGCALSLIIGRKNIPNKLTTVNEGIQKVAPAMITTATSVGFGGAVLACSGANIIINSISGMQTNPIISLSIASIFAGVLTGNGGGAADIAMSLLSNQYLSMGVYPEILHRVVAIATGGLSCLPHSGMVLTVSNTCGFSIRSSYKYIFVSTVLSSFIGLIVSVTLGCIMYPIT